MNTMTDELRPLDENAFSARVEPHRRELHVHCYRLLGSFEDAQDLVQEAFLRAWRHIAEYDPRFAFSTWLFTIARRTWLNQARATRRRRTREAAVASGGLMCDGAAAVAIAAERATRLWQVARGELSEREFSGLWMRYVEDKPVAEIALVLDKPVATVKVILFRARRRLGPLVRDLAGWSE